MKTPLKKKIGEWTLPKECIACDAEDTYERVEVETEKNVRGETFTAKHHSWHCSECGAGILGPKEVDEATKAAVAEYQKKHLLLTAKAIKDGRKKLGFSQAAFAKVAGLGSASIKRWEGGMVIQTAAYDKVLRKCVKDCRTEKNPAVIVRERLSRVGIKKNYFEKYVSPSDWDDTFALTADGLLRFAGIVMQRTGFAIDTLLDEKQNLRLATNVVARYKKDTNINRSKLAMTEAICAQFAKMIAGAMNGTPSISLPDPFELRKELLSAGGLGWIGFDQLVNCCWDHGIAVVHISDFPTGSSKPTAMAMMIEERPVVVICKKKISVAWMIFFLAHEMGHVFHDHLSSASPLIDNKVTPGEAEGKEEGEANDFADKLLMDEIRFAWPQKRISGRNLANLASGLGEKYQISPGTVALSYAYQEGHWSLASQALKIVEEGERNPIETINLIADERLEWNDVREESRDWFSRMTGMTASK